MTHANAIANLDALWPEPGPQCLDGLVLDELEVLAVVGASDPYLLGRRADETQERPYAEVLEVGRDLQRYLCSSVRARYDRAAGEIASAIHHEVHAEAAYQRLPAWARW